MQPFIQSGSLKTLLGVLTIAGLCGCAQANAGPETAKQLPLEPAQQIVVVKSKDGQRVQWDSSMSEADLEQTLAELPAEKAAKLRELLQQIAQGKLAGHEGKIRVLTLGDGAEPLLADNMVVKQLKLRRLSEFSEVRQAIRDGKFSKAELQELQQLLDSKF